jgi:hypothetical protein
MIKLVIINNNAFDNLDKITFFKVIYPLISLQKNQDMKNDGNCGYYAIISQIMPKYF